MVVPLSAYMCNIYRSQPLVKSCRRPNERPAKQMAGILEPARTTEPQAYTGRSVGLTESRAIRSGGGETSSRIETTVQRSPQRTLPQTRDQSPQQLPLNGQANERDQSVPSGGRDETSSSRLCREDGPRPLGSTLWRTLMQSVRKFMLSSPAWVIFGLMVVGPLVSLMIRGKASDSYYPHAASAFSAACVALWYIATITTSNRIQSLFKPWAVGLCGLVLVSYVTLPLCREILSGFQIIDSTRYSTDVVSTVVIVWSLAASVGVLVVAFIASKSLCTSSAVEKPKIGDIIIAFLAFSLYPLGVWFLQPKLTELHRRAA